MGFFTISLVHALILSCGSITFGSIIAFGSATLRIIKVTFGPLSTFTVGAFQAAPACIGILAPIFWNFMLKKKGIKISSSILGFSGCVFWLLLLTMNKRYFWLTITFRAFLGITLAGCSALCPLYLQEIAPQNKKGLYGTFHIIFIVVGHIITNLLGVTHKWRPPIFVCSVFMLILGSGVFLIPDSHKKVEDIEEKYDDSSDENDQFELKTTNSNIENSSSFEDLNEPDPKNMSIFDKSILKQSIVSMSLFLLMQFGGIASIMQNLAPLMSEVGINIDAGYQATIAICAQFISAVLSSILIDKYGCKILWCVSSAGSSLSLFLYSLNVKFNWSRWLPMIFLFSFQFFFGIGMGTMPWIVPSFVYPQEIKPKAISFGTSINWFAATIVMFLFPYLQQWFGQFGLMLILSIINLLGFFVGIFFLDDFMKKNQQNKVYN